MNIKLAFYKGKPRVTELFHFVSHYLICLRTWSKYSHVELVMDGLCYSSSSMDGGVRAKTIDLNSGKWDLIQVNLTNDEAAKAKQWFIKNYGKNYDWLNILRFIFPWVKPNPNQYICSEAVGEALALPNAYKLTPQDLFVLYNYYRPFNKA